MTELEQVINRILVVREFPNVFPKDIPRLPLRKEIEFFIDLVPRTSSIVVAPYRISLA